MMIFQYRDKKDNLKNNKYIKPESFSLFDLDRTTLAPAKCFSASNFFNGSYCTISTGKEHAFVDVLASFRIVCLRSLKEAETSTKVLSLPILIVQ